MYKLTLGEVRFVMDGMLKEIRAMEESKVITSNAAAQLSWFKAELDKRLNHFCQQK